MRYLLICLLCAGCIQAVLAQYSVGLQGGYTRAWEEYGDADIPENAKIHIHGFHISALIYSPFHKHLFIGSEPGFVRRGAACVPGFQVFTNETKFLFNYIEIPLFIKYQIPFGTSKWSLHGKAGYSGSWLVSGTRIDITNQGWGQVTTETKLDFDTESEFQRFDHGLHAGIDLCYNVKNAQLFMYSSYYNSFVDAVDFTTSKNRGINFGLGCTLPI
jgi:hypothetical protein